jgi:hypothetical protein
MRETKIFWLIITMVVLFVMLLIPLVIGEALFGAVVGVIDWEAGVLILTFGLGCIFGPIYMYTHHSGWYKADFTSILIMSALLLVVVGGIYFVNEGRLKIIEAHEVEPLKSLLPQLLRNIFH